MTTSQASRIFGIPYNSLLMYVRGKYGKSLKLEQLRKDCISGPPIELLQMGVSKGSNPNGTNNNNSGSGKEGHNNGSAAHHSNKDQKDYDMPMSGGGGGVDMHGDLMSNSNAMFNPFPANFYPDFPAGFPGLPLSMLNLLPPDSRQAASLAAAAAASAGHHLNMSSMDDDEDCKSEDRSKQSLDDDDVYQGSQPLDLNRHEGLHRQEMIMQHQD